MGWFKKKNIFPDDGYFPISTDIHSHILPGLDDGSPDIETSLELISRLMKLGINRSIATPHIIGDLYPNNPDTIQASLQLLRNALAGRKINFEVSAAAEYMLDGYFFDLLGKSDALLTLKDKILLTEFPFMMLPHYAGKVAFDLIIDGYKPILAHPERYSYAHGNYGLFHRWVEVGYLLQVNLLSLTGYYGREAEKAAKYIVKNNLATYLGTDLHHPRHMDALQSEKNHRIFHELLSDKEWNTVF